MQRRSFLQSSTSMAALALPAVSLAHSSSGQGIQSGLAISLLSSDPANAPSDKIGGGDIRGPVTVRVANVQARPDADVRFRLWFAAEEGRHAFELASFSPIRGRSSSLRLQADSERLLAIDAELAGSVTEVCSASAQCLLSQGGLGRLKPGTHWIVLHAQDTAVKAETDSAVIAAVQLDVEAA